MANNFISKAVSTWKSHSIPIQQALAIGGAAYGLGRLAWSPVVETIRTVAKPVFKSWFPQQPGLPPEEIDRRQEEDWNIAMDELKRDSKYSHYVPGIFGALAALSSLGFTSDLARKNFRLFDWSAPLRKSGNWMGESSYAQDLNWDNRINANVVNGMLNNDPHLVPNPYVQNFGTAIVQNAAIQNHTNKPTVGNIFDSAVDKIEKKLTLGGLANVGVRTVIANGTARLFAGALDSVCGLEPENRQKLVDAGTWAGAISAILS